MKTKALEGDCPVCHRPLEVCRRNYLRRKARWDAQSPAEKASRQMRTLRSTYPEPCRR